MSNLIIDLIILCVLMYFLKDYLIIIAIALIGSLIIYLINIEKSKREKAAETWRKEQEQKEKEHKKYIEEQDRQKLLQREQERQKRLREHRRSVAEDAFSRILQGLTQYEIKLSDEKVLRQVEMCNPIEDTKNITKATKFEKLRDFIAIDTETTGLKCGGNDIIEICAIKFLKYRPVEKFHTYLKPRKSIPASATEINGITDDMVCNAPKFSQIKSSLQEFIGDLPLVAHNAPFDMKFLHVSGLNLENHSDKVYDTLKLSRLKLRNYDGSKFDSYKLSDLCDELNIGCTSFHTADSDTLACGLLFIEILKSIKEVDSIDDF